MSLDVTTHITENSHTLAFEIAEINVHAGAGAVIFLANGFVHKTKLTLTPEQSLTLGQQLIENVATRQLKAIRQVEAGQLHLPGVA